MKPPRTDDFMDLAGIISELRSMEARIAAINLQLEQSEPATSELETGRHSFTAMRNERAKASATPAPGIPNESRCHRVRQ
jgi:hypothetical protein